MNNKWNVAFITGSRADYGIVRRYLSLLDNDSEIKLDIVVTGALLSDDYGHQVDLIYADGFRNIIEIPVEINSSNNTCILHTMSQILDCFGSFFEANKYDLVIILGDRYEMLPVATAAAMHKIHILHLHGGEATFGNYDEFIRHSITKMSRFHFTATEEYRKRVIQLGEVPENVFYLGALGAENCLSINENNVSETVKALPEKKYFVVLFHPETLTNADVEQQTEELISVLRFFPQYMFVFIGSNADTYSNLIRKRIKEFVDKADNVRYFENLHSDAYHYLVKHSVCLIGNSSSGIIEAPSLGVYSINIGERQKGRTRGNSVVDVACNSEQIRHAIEKVLKIHDCIKPENPYYKFNAANEYYRVTKSLLKKSESLEPKIFYDL